MIPLERQQKIMEFLDVRGVLSINELVDKLQVSHMTIRRDLQKLEQDGLVMQVSGGVQALKKLHTEPQLAERQTLAKEEKSRIGRAALAHIPENSCIFIDAGTTGFALAEQVAPRSDLTIIANDLEIITYLARHSQSDLVLIGGQVRKKIFTCVGPLATDMLRHFSIDLAFIAATSWDARGITTPDMDKVSVKKAVVESSVSNILLADSSKYGKVAKFIAMPINTFSLIITDNALPSAARQIIQNLDIELELA